MYWLLQRQKKKKREREVGEGREETLGEAERMILPRD